MAVTAYRGLGWPAFQVGSIVWTTPGIAVEALNVPADLGRRVLACLSDLDVDLPVINVPPDRCALLARPHTGPVDEILALLNDVDVGYAHGGRGAEWGIDLPPTCHPGRHPLTWLRPPSTPLPPLMTVVRALLTSVS